MVATLRIIGFILIVLGIGIIFYGAEKYQVMLAYAGIGITFIGLIINIVLLFKKSSAAPDTSQPQSINTPFG